MKYLFTERDVRSEEGMEELYSLSKTRGLLPRTEITDKEERADTLTGYKKFFQSDLVMNKMQAWNGVFGFADGCEGIISPDYSIFRAIADIDQRFFTYLFKTNLYAGIFSQLARGMGTAFLRLNTSEFGSVDVPLPPVHEQTRIANFLDEQTARIDALIAEKERLDALLGEYRGSLISAAVTGQLDPTTGEAPRQAHEKGGGVSKVVFGRTLPANWGRMRLRHIARFVSGGTPSKDNGAFWRGQIPWFSPKDFSSRVLADSEDHISAEAVEASATTMLMAGTPVFVVRSGILRHTIPIALLGVNGCINQDVKGVLLKENLEARYFVYIVEGLQAELIDEWTKQGATVESIEQQFVSNTYFPIPSSQEQTRIANFLDEQTARIDDLRNHCREHIALLREYRSSLISAAVTGQLDIDAFGRQVA